MAVDSAATTTTARSTMTKPTPTTTPTPVPTTSFLRTFPRSIWDTSTMASLPPLHVAAPLPPHAAASLPLPPPSRLSAPAPPASFALLSSLPAPDRAAHSGTLSGVIGDVPLALEVIAAMEKPASIPNTTTTDDADAYRTY